MGLIDRLFGSPRRGDGALNRNPYDDRWFEAVALNTAGGMPVTEQSAITLPVVYDCLNVLSGSIGSLPFAVFERVADGGRRRTDNHPLQRVLEAPNPETDPVTFVTQMVWDLAARGNFYAEIVAGDIGPVSQLWRLEPEHVQVERLSDRSRRWVYREPGRTERRFVEGEVWHIRRPPLVDGLMGTSPIHAGREAISAALALQDYAARFFNNDARPPFFVEYPGKFADEDSRKNFIAAMRRLWGGKNRHSPAVLEHGMTVSKLGATNEEAQFLETRNALDLALTRIWHMQPHKVGILDKASFSNIEQQALEFVTDTLLPWLRLIERSVALSLLIRPDRFFFEFNVAGLLRGDIKARFDAYAQGRQWGWLSVNEIRRLENMNPVPEGDTRLQPLNMVPAGEDPREGEEPEARVFGPDGAVVSQIVGGNVVRLRRPSHAA